jgi:hypothetical protein
MATERSVVRGHYRRSLRGFVACAAAGLVLAGVAGADGQTSFPDPVGDAGSSVDLTGLRVSSFGVSDSSAGVGLEATAIRNRLWCGGEGGDLPLLIAIDTDQNPDTGSAFYGTEVEFAFDVRDNEPLFLRAKGWDFKLAPDQDFPGSECGPTIGGYFTETTALGITPTSGFNVVAWGHPSSNLGPGLALRQWLMSPPRRALLGSVTTAEGGAARTKIEAAAPETLEPRDRRQGGGSWGNQGFPHGQTILAITCLICV